MAPVSSYFFNLTVVAGAAVMACFIFATEAFSFDVHELFESRCGSCHNHAGELAQDKRVITNGLLRGKTSNRDIRAFLPVHYGNPNPIEVTALHDLLSWQVRVGGEFKKRCAICHVRARKLAQSNLIRDGNALRGRYSDHNMTDFLISLGRIEAAEVDFIIQLFKRLAPTIDHH